MLCSGIPAYADDQSAIIQRLDKLEKENAALKREVNRLESKTPVAAPAAPQTASRTQPPGALVNSYPGPIPAPGMATKVPVQYVRVCDMYGAGFYFVPGTGACIKIGGYIRLQGGTGTNGDGVVLGADTMALQGRNDRTDTNPFNVEGRAVVSVDVRTQTDWGQLHGYLRMGPQFVTPNGELSTVAGSATPSIFWDRGYIQFAGFTVGKQRSFFDIYSPTEGYLTYMNPRTGADTNLTGVLLAAYTYRFVNGFSATLSVENPNDHFNAGVSNLGLAGQFGLGTLTTDNGFANNTGGVGFGIPDIIGNLRTDQPWGYAGVSAVLHQVAAGYYTAANIGNLGTGCTAGTPCNGFGYPDNEFGWAVALGGDVNLPTGRGDTFGTNLAYGHGAINYVARGSKWQLYSSNSNNTAGFAWGVNGVFDNQSSITNLAGTPIQLTDAFSINSGFEHVWNERWRTSLYGGYAAIMYDTTAKTIINSHLPGAGGALICGTPVFGAVQPPLGITAGSGNSCNPNYSFWDVGTRTQWNPFPWLDLGVDVSYTRFNTAYAGSGVGLAVNGAQPSGTAYTIANQNVVAVLGRAQINFWPGE